MARLSRYFIAGCAMLTIVCGVAAHAQAPAPVPVWTTYSYSDEGFSALFPSQPTMAKKIVQTDAGPFELRSYIVELQDSALFIGVCDYGNATQGRDVDAMLQGAMNGALSNSQSHLTSGPRKITIGANPGIEFESESDAAHFTARVYWVGSSLYQTLVVETLHKPYADAQRFLNSFQLIARNPG